MALLALPTGYADKIAFGLPKQGAPPPAHVLDARVGSLRVLGYDLTSSVLHRGESTDLVTHFELADHLEPGWKLFFHLEGPNGFRNLDHVPVEGAYPLERWRPGQRIRDRLSINFPASMPPGTYNVYVGLWKGTARAPVTPKSASDGRDRLRLATISVR